MRYSITKWIFRMKNYVSYSSVFPWPICGLYLKSNGEGELTRHRVALNPRPQIANTSFDNLDLACSLHRSS